MPQGVSWPRPRLQVGWERVGESRGADSRGQTLRVCLLFEKRPTQLLKCV